MTRLKANFQRYFYRVLPSPVNEIPTIKRVVATLN